MLDFVFVVRTYPEGEFAPLLSVWRALRDRGRSVGVLELGVLNAAYREIPYARGQGRRARARRLRALSLGMACLSAAGSTVLVIGVGAWLLPHLRPAVVILGLVVAGREGYLLLSTWTRAAAWIRVVMILMTGLLILY